MSDIPVKLHGEFGRKILYDIAYRYAVAWIESVATVREAPTCDKRHEARRLEIRDTLLSVCAELPEITEPEWPLLYSLSDDFTPGTMTVKPGRKKKPTYRKEYAWKHAKEWAAAFVSQVTGTEYRRHD